MITFKDVVFVYPTKDILDNVSFNIDKGDHAVLIGSNGSGKSTLIKLLMNPEIYTYEGDIKRDEGMRISCVNQFVKHEDSDITAYDYLAEPFISFQKRIDEICAAMADENAPEDIFDRYQECLDEMDSVDGYNYDSNILKELAIAGISEICDTPVNLISGGEYKLLSIIRSILMKPQLLIMDEPDVFLDFENLVGLSKLINSYDGTILSITHNRLLLSQCFDKVLHLENESLQQFSGNYADYNHTMLLTKLDMHMTRSKFDDYISEQRNLIEKMRKEATETTDPKKGRQLRARSSYLDRIINMRGEYPFLEDDKYDFTFVPKDKDYITSDAPLQAEDSASVENAVSSEGNQMISNELSVNEEKKALLTINNYSLSFDREILKDVNFEVFEGDKIAFVGANGTGKSSILKDIYKMLCEKSPDRVAMFSQIYDDDLETLSGGERNIRQIEEIRKSGADILILDEPTSHLDIYAQAALERAVQAFNGTVLMVSHDFYMVSGLADRILLLENGTIREQSPRAYRKSVYKKYFESDIFEAERKRKEIEMRVNSLLAQKKYDLAEKLLTE